MWGEIQSWLQLAVRWFHLTAGIAWIGSSFYFMWLDASLKANPKAPKGVAGELWAVHGGGFYHKQKYSVAPASMPDELHWFKWEAYTTWITGFFLLVLIYWVGAATWLISPDKTPLTPWEGIGISAAFLVGGWLVYDGLCRTPLGKSPLIFGAVWFAILTTAAWGLTRLFDDRAAFVHVGAIVGTAMVANVFLIIIPNQRKVVAAMLAGTPVDPALGKQAKQRSVHNNYMTLPVLFLMISNHFPMVFAHPLNWLLLAGISLSGVLIRHYFNLKHQGSHSPLWLLNGMGVFVAVMLLAVATKPQTATVTGATLVQVEAIVDAHCVMCHSASPTHASLNVAPNGVAFDTPAQIRQYAPRIFDRAVATTSMPMGNETHMTDQERATLGAWIKAGAQ